MSFARNGTFSFLSERVTWSHPLTSMLPSPSKL